MTRPVLRVREVAAELGVSEDFVRDRIRDGSLRARKLGRFTRVTQADLDAYVASLPVHGHEPSARPAEATPPRRRGPQPRIERRVLPFKEATS